MLRQFICTALTAGALVSSASAAHCSEMFRYVVTPTGLEYYTPTEDPWTLPADAFLKCTTASYELIDPSGGRGVVVKSCRSHRSPVEKRWVQTFAVDPRNWSSCNVDGLDNRLLVLVCPTIYQEAK